MASSRAALVLAQALSVSAIGQCSTDLQEGICFSGDNFKKVNVADAAECCSACEAEADCTHFTFSGSSSCGLKKGTPVSGSHTHCTSGVRAGPTPSPTPPTPTPPTPTPTPPTPTPTPPTPTPTPPSPPPAPHDHSPIDGVSYEVDGKCLRVDGQQHNNRFFNVAMGDCNDARSTWSEGFSHSSHSAIKFNFQPQVQAKVGGTQTCLSAPDGCHAGAHVRTWICSTQTSSEHPRNRVFWNENLKLIQTSFCWGFCVDVSDDGQPVIKPCADINTQWTRNGPAPRPTVVREQPGPPGPMNGRYYMTYPMPQVNGFTVAGTGDDGYPDYFGNMNAEVCPDPMKVKDHDGFWRCHQPMKSEVPMYKSPKHTPNGPNYPIKRSVMVQRAIVWVANHWYIEPNKGKLSREDYEEDFYYEETQGESEDDDEAEGDGELGVTKHGHCRPGQTCNVDGCGEGETEYCPQFFHGGACCATVGNAWNASTSGCFRNSGSSIRVPCHEMRPGDVVSRGGGDKTSDTGKNFPGGHHVVVFRKWDTPDKKAMIVFTNRRYTAVPAPGPNDYCFKRKNIIEDIEGDTQWDKFEIVGGAEDDDDSEAFVV